MSRASFSSCPLAGLTVGKVLSIIGRQRGVAQLVAHSVWDAGVAGSNPVSPTSVIINNQLLIFNGHCRRRSALTINHCQLIIDY